MYLTTRGSPAPAGIGLWLGRHDATGAGFSPWAMIDVLRKFDASRLRKPGGFSNRLNWTLVFLFELHTDTSLHQNGAGNRPGEYRP